MPEGRAKWFSTDGRLWVTDAIDPDQTGYRWSAEAVGPHGFDKTAGGVTATFWGAQRKVRRYTRQWLAESGTRRPEHTSAGRGGRLLCRLGLHSHPRSQGAVGYCSRGCGDLLRSVTGAGGWVRYVEQPRDEDRPPGPGLPRRD